MRSRRPSRRQRDFALAYLETGCAAKAARAAGYKGRYAAQAGYKLLKRPGTITEIRYWKRLEQRSFRASLMRVMRRVSRLLAHKNLPLKDQRNAAEPLLRLARALGMASDPACEVLQQKLQRKPPNLRRHYRREWENGDGSEESAWSGQEKTQAV